MAFGMAGRTTTCRFGIGAGAGAGCAGGATTFGATVGLVATNGGGSSGFINMLIMSGVHTTSLLSVFDFFAAGG